MSASRGTTTPPPPPIIGKAGRYTVFITPPPQPSETPETPSSDQRPTSTDKMSPTMMDEIPVKIHPVQPPPQQFSSKIYNEKSANENSKSFGFFWNAVAKVQSVHSSVDEYIADWFGLNHSKYQWALNEYYENNGFDKDGQKSKEVTSKGQRV